MTSTSNNGPLLVVERLRTELTGEAGVTCPVDGVGFTLSAGETLGLVGESGCGKTMTALSLLGLVPSPSGKVVDGRVLFRGRDLLRASEDQLRSVRGNEIAMIFQEPTTALNPVFTVGEQIAEVLRLHRDLDRRAARTETVRMLAQVGLPSPEVQVRSYPHQLSGGMRQRVMIAMAMACDPAVLIADEPTTALDVTVQAQILELIRELQEQRGTAVLLITHDLGVIAETADRVCVMYAGQIVEEAPVVDLFEGPRHPYTRALLRSLPDAVRPGEELSVIPGTVPGPHDFPTGCRFRTRCPLARQRCEDEEPSPLVEGRRAVACHFPDEVEDS